MLTNEMKKEIIARLQNNDGNVASYLVKECGGKRALERYLAFLKVEIDEDYYDTYHHKVIIIDLENRVAFSSNYTGCVTTKSELRSEQKRR